MSASHQAPDAASRLRRARFIDRLAARVISVGGIGVLAAVVAIFVFIGYEVLPLLGSATVDEAGSFDSATGVLAVDVDEYRTAATTVSSDGVVRTFGLDDGAQRSEVKIEGGAKLNAAVVLHHPATMLAVDDAGRLHTAQFVSKISFDDAGTRSVVVRTESLESLDVRDDGEPLTLVSGMFIDEERVIAVAAGPNFLAALRFRIGGDNVKVMPLEGVPLDDPAAAVRALEMAHFGDSYRIYAGLLDGRVFRWDGDWADDPELIESVSTIGGPVTALATLLGEETLVTATENGPVQTWFGVRASPDAPGWNLSNIREFPRLPAPVTLIVPTTRGKGFVLFDTKGHGRVDHHTTDRTLVNLPDLGARPVAACVTPKNDAIVVVDETGRLHRLDYTALHPETTLETLFMPVWYESGEQPDLKWQSTGGGDDFEPKFSLSVLVFGSLKGVLYALVFSVPIGVLAAIYTALFLPGRLRNVIKPAIEILAAIPSVVVGLLAALWLSPIVERNLTTVFALVPAFLFTSVLILTAWAFVPRRRAARILSSPWLLLITFGSFVIPFVLALAIGPLLDESVFGGDVQGWMRSALGVSYTNRNAMIVGFALGFAVIPVIFTISEDAIMNVPRSLWAASEALGATRWQTTWRVVVPAAAPGIFAALMLGFGRAVGETMIVLLAAGNTPLIDLSPFSGMRTISACIAVEIPEAPHGGTLYRVLFLSGVLLFLFTFVCNTVAEIVGHRLRRKYGRF